jgi:hypothetical protein
METFQEELLDRAASVLKLLGNGLEVDLSLDETGACYFEHDDGWRMAITLAGEDQIVTAISVLPNIEPPSGGELGAILTEFNWLGGLTNGLPLAWNPTSQSFVLWHSADIASLDAKALNATMLRLVTAAGELQPILRARLDGGPAPDNAEAEDHHVLTMQERA